MVYVKFYDNVEISKLKYVVIMSKYKDKWVFSKHKKRDTYEIPGGHIENGETAIQAAKRELFEETGAIEYNMKHLGYYSVIDEDCVINNEEDDFGALYYAEIKKFEQLPEEFEMEKIEFFDTFPSNVTYPNIYPKLYEFYLKYKI